MNDIIVLRQSIYNLRKFKKLSTSSKNTVNFGTEIYVSYLLISVSLIEDHYLTKRKSSFRIFFDP